MNIDTVINWVDQVIRAERAHVSGWDAPQLEQRIRRVQELELASRLRHVIGGLDVVLAARGPDIQSANPPFEIQVKCLNYWHTQNSNPQPIPADQIDKDLAWLFQSTDVPRFVVLFFPRRKLGYAVQKAGADFASGQRRFQNCISAKGDILSGLRYVGLLVKALAEVVDHMRTNGTTSPFFQYRNVAEYSADLDDLMLKTVGDPANDLFWAVVVWCGVRTITGSTNTIQSKQVWLCDCRRAPNFQ